jgi:PAS domain S-box-containing protein
MTGHAEERVDVSTETEHEMPDLALKGPLPSSRLGTSPHQHSVQFYETDAFLREAVANFVAAGIVAGEPALIIATAVHREAFLEGLSARGVNTSRAIGQGMLVLLDAEETLQGFMVRGTPDWTMFTETVGGALAAVAASFEGKPVRAYGEMVDVLWRAGQQTAAIRLEEMWNDLRGHCEFSLMCAYVIDSFYKQNGILDVCAAHSHVLLPERHTPHIEQQDNLAETVRSLIAEVARRTELEGALRDSLRQLRAAEESALRAKEDLEDFLDNAVIAIHRVDGDGIIRWANAAELELLGYEAAEYVGHHISEFHVDQPVIHDILERLRSGETLRDYEARVRAKTGEIRILQISSNMQMHNGECVMTRCFSRDVTGRKAAERRSAVLHRITSLLSRTLSAEEAARAIIGEVRQLLGASVGAVLLLDPAGSAIDRVFIDADHPELSAATLGVARLDADTPICEAARTGKPVWVVGKDTIRGRYPHLTFLDPEAPGATLGAMPIGFEGKNLGAIGILCTANRPLSSDEAAVLLAIGQQYGQAFERSRLHDSTQHSRNEAEQANRAKDEFLAILGHELRNPLSPILTAVQLMRMRGEVSSTREQNIIERQINHLMHIVDDLLDISRVARGKVQLHKRAVNLASLITKAVEIIGPMCEERHHRLDVIMPDQEIWLEADETRLCQVFTNVLSNAAKYTPPGGRIELKSVLCGSRVSVHVTDNGQGIAPDLLPRIFDLFVQGNRSSDRKLGGLGIGLALVRSLVQMHGGSVSAFSKGLAQGSEFVIDLPTIEVDRAPRLPSDGENNLRNRLRVTARRVLLVDDNEDACSLLGEMLRSVGHDVVVTLDGPRAIEAVKHFVPEVAILDIGLPVMDGYELAAALRSRLGPGLRLMAVTGYGQEQDRARALESGFECHFVKPLSIQKLLAAIELVAGAAPVPTAAPIGA